MSHPRNLLPIDGSNIVRTLCELDRQISLVWLIAREVQQAGAFIRSIAEPSLDTTSDFAETVFAILGVRRNSNAAAFSNAQREAAPTPRHRA
jgi:hypothetical protein